MYIYQLENFNKRQKIYSKGKVFFASYNNSDEVFFVKDILSNQLINLIIANPLFRLVLWQRTYS